MGLFGNMLVDAPDRDYYSPANREAALVLGDLLINADTLVAFGVEREREPLPESVHGCACIGGHRMVPASVTADDACRHRRDHARAVYLLGEHKGTVCGDRRQRNFYRGVIEAGAYVRYAPADDQPDDRPAAGASPPKYVSISVRNTIDVPSLSKLSLSTSMCSRPGAAT